MAGNLLRQSQVVTTFGPGSMLDLPKYSVIVTGLSTWTKAGRREIVEPRLIAKLQKKLDLPQLQLFSPPIQSDDPHSAFSGVGAQVFPTWFIVQDAKPSGPGGQWRRRRLVRWQDLDRGRFVDPDDRKKKTVVPVRFVCGCPRGHIDDLDWRAFVHGRGAECSRSMWLEERGTSGDIAETYAGCECRRERSLYEALGIDTFALGICGGKRPWLGPYAREECKQPQRLLVRTASNAYFPQLMSVISLPEQDEGISAKIGAVWNILQAVQGTEMLQTFRAIPDVAAALDGLSDDEVMREIERRRMGQGAGEERPVKQAEFDVLNSGHAHIGRDDPHSSFFAETVLRSEWDPSAEPTVVPIEKLVLVHRLREVIALIGFTRFEAVNPNTDGELDLDVEPAALDLEPTWLPAVEHKGEGIFISFRQDRITAWLQNEHVKARGLELMRGFDAWCKVHKDTHRVFPGLPYILLHSLSHLLLTAIALECGYPASSLRERVYASDGQYGILIYTGSSDSEGTLGGLIEAGRHIGRHLTHALDLARLCSNDPVCSEHHPDNEHEARPLQGAACHGCLLIAETSCEQRNDLLDRALVVPTVSLTEAAFLSPASSI